MELNYSELGYRIRKKRLQQKMTQETLAELTDLSIPHVSHIETGKTKVSLESLVKIAKDVYKRQALNTVMSNPKMHYQTQGLYPAVILLICNNQNSY